MPFWKIAAAIFIFKIFDPTVQGIAVAVGIGPAGLLIGFFVWLLLALLIWIAFGEALAKLDTRNG